MVFDRRFNRGLTSIPWIRLGRTTTERRAPPAAPGLLRPLDPVLLNGVGLHVGEHQPVGQPQGVVDCQATMRHRWSVRI